MAPSNFARRHGYEEEHPIFKLPDYLPDQVRLEAGFMMAECFENLIEPPVYAALEIKEGLAWPYKTAHRRFAEVVGRTLPPSQKTMRWYKDTVYRVLESTELLKIRVRRRLIVPIMLCDWRHFYEVVENVRAELCNIGLMPAYDFAPAFNYLLNSHGIPWILQSGLVIPLADAEFAEELKHAREASSSTGPEHASNPHVLIGDALQAFYRKPDGPDISAACVHAWGAWKAAAGAASGFGARDKRSFDFVKEKYPRLYDTMAAWQELAEAGRHPESEGFPTESETRFIVMLCVNAVRLLSSTRNNKDAT